MSSNNQSNRLIKRIIMLGDFLLLNILILTYFRWSGIKFNEPNWNLDIFILVNNIALILAQMRFSTIIHLRLVGAGDVLRRIVWMTVTQSILAYVLLNVFYYYMSVGWLQFWLGTIFFMLLLIKRLVERWFIKLYRQAGRNTRTVTLIGHDPELMTMYENLTVDQTKGYRVLGYYADEDMGECTHSIVSDGKRTVGNVDEHNNDEKDSKIDLKRLGSLQDFLRLIGEDSENLELGDEIYVSLSRRDRDIIKQISRFCDRHMIRFYYVPVTVETIGLNLKRELLDNMEVYTTYENPLQNSMNRFVKRIFDIVLSLVFLIPTALLLPFIWLIIKIQSPGPLLFKQVRTGLDGKEFECYKFRSMHVNKDADKVQATKDDPRKFPFGNFMRKTNIDELPQFFNVLQGKMSIVGPRPHMLAHTEQYSKLIDKYMVRHFVKPGVTGWAQVTGFRGETKELWQMEGRVKRDIWYMENWSIWLDIRIIWLTFKTFFVHDKNAY